VNAGDPPAADEVDKSGDDPDDASRGDEDTEDSDEAADDGAGGDVDEFCDFLVEMDAQGDLDFEDDPDEVAAVMAEMRRLAPREIRDEIDVMLDILVQMAEMDEDDPDAFGEIMALMFDPEVIAAGETLEEFGVEECGLEPEDDDETDFGFDDSDVNVDEDDEDARDPASIDAMQDYVDDAYSQESWADKLSSWVRIGSDISVGPIAEELSEDEAFAACDALLEYLTSIDSDAQLTISDSEGNPLVMRGRGDPACTHA
jgi:hypothetical protein